MCPGFGSFSVYERLASRCMYCTVTAGKMDWSYIWFCQFCTTTSKNVFGQTVYLSYKCNFFILYKREFFSILCIRCPFFNLKKLYNICHFFNGIFEKMLCKLSYCYSSFGRNVNVLYIEKGGKNVWGNTACSFLIQLKDGLVYWEAEIYCCNFF